MLDVTDSGAGDSFDDSTCGGQGQGQGQGLCL